MPLPLFSSELARFRALTRSPAVYGLAPGQPRQENLVAYLSENTDEGALEDIKSLQIDLSPR